MVRRIAGAAPTGKDLLPKMAWLAEHEPGTMSRTAAFGDATSFLVARATGRVALDPTAAGATGMFDPRRRRWSRGLARLSGMPLDRMPPIVECAQTAAAQALGLRTGTPVAMGMADIPAAALGSGATRPGDAHVYLGTSAWIAMTLTRPRNVPRAGIVSVAHPEPGACLLIAESETAGACRDWATDHLEVDHAGLDALAAGSPPGARGLLFCPWLFGERSPVPDSGLRGGLLNLSLGHTRADTARAVLEGVALNLRWILDAVDGATGRRGPLRAIGGGAQSDLWLQILADILAQPIERVGDSRFAGALGAALCGAVAVGDLASLRAIRDRIHVDRTFVPDPAAAPATNRALAALRQAAAPLSRIAGLLRHEGVA